MTNPGFAGFNRPDASTNAKGFDGTGRTPGFQPQIHIDCNDVSIYGGRQHRGLPRRSWPPVEALGVAGGFPPNLVCGVVAAVATESEWLFLDINEPGS